jgi:hypothetical protein
MKKPKAVAFDFVLEELHTLHPVVKPMFGCHAVYVGEKIVLILRKKTANDPDNGVWVATTKENHQSLKVLFPNMRSIKVFGGGETGWQLLPENAVDFEESVGEVCKLIMRHDKRVGKIPKKKNTKKEK